MLNRSTRGLLKLLAVPLVVAAIVLTAGTLVLADVPFGIGTGGSSSTPHQVVPPPQAEFLQDGVVTDDEMRAAVARTVSCIAAEGLAASVPPGSPNGVDRIILVTTRDESSSSAVRACKQQFMDQVDQVYGRQLAGTLPSQEELDRALRECLRERGFSISEITSERLTEINDSGPDGSLAIRDCMGGVGSSPQKP